MNSREREKMGEGGGRRREGAILATKTIHIHEKKRKKEEKSIMPVKWMKECFLGIAECSGKEKDCCVHAIYDWMNRLCVQK